MTVREIHKYKLKLMHYRNIKIYSNLQMDISAYNPKKGNKRSILDYTFWIIAFLLQL